MADLITDVSADTLEVGNTDTRYDHATNHNNVNTQVNQHLAAITGLGLTKADITYVQDALDNLDVDINYTNTTPTPTQLGGVPAGSTFNNQSVVTVFNRLFYPYQFPSFTSFAINSQPQTVEVGTSITGSKTFSWSSSNTGNVNTNSVSISSGAVLASDLPATGSQAITLATTQLTAPGSRSWSISGTNTQAGTYSSNFTVNWLWRVFAGTSGNPTLTATQIQALASNNLSGAGYGTYNFAAGGYKFICYPTSMGAANGFTDTSTQLSVTMADSTDDASFSNTANGWSYAIVSVTNSLSQTTNYRVYRTKYTLGGSINIAVN